MAEESVGPEMYNGFLSIGRFRGGGETATCEFFFASPRKGTHVYVLCEGGVNNSKKETPPPPFLILVVKMLRSEIYGVISFGTYA